MCAIFQRLFSSLISLCTRPGLIVGACLLMLQVGFSQDLLNSFEDLEGDVGRIQGMPINCLFQDDFGILWIGTYSGLFQYDGRKVSLVENFPSHHLGLPSHMVNRIFRDSRGMIWLSTISSGVFRYDVDQDSFFSQPLPPPFGPESEQAEMWEFAETSEGTLWMASERGLLALDLDSYEVQHVPLFMPEEVDSRRFKETQFTRSLAVGPDGLLWVGTQAGLACLDTRRGFQQSDPVIHWINLAPDGIREENRPYWDYNEVLSLEVSKTLANTLWVGTNSGLQKLTYSLDTHLDISLQAYHAQLDPGYKLSQNRAFVITEQRLNGNAYLWIGTLDGINRLNIHTDQIVYSHIEGAQYGLHSQEIRALLVDRSGGMFLGTEKGLQFYNPFKSAFRSIEPSGNEVLEASIIRDLSLSTDGKKVWVALAGRGIGIWENPNNLKGEVFGNPYFELRPENTHYVPLQQNTILLDEKGWFWMGTKGEGLHIASERSLHGSLHSPPPFVYFKDSVPALSHNHIMVVKPSVYGHVWVGYWEDGLSLHTSPENIAFPLLSKADSARLGEFPIVEFFETTYQGDTLIWIGTRGKGLYQARYFPEHDSLAILAEYAFGKGSGRELTSNFINDIIQPFPAEIWVATTSGINILDLNTFAIRIAPFNEQLSNQVVNVMIKDPFGNVWAGTKNGLGRVFTKKGKLQVQNYFKTDGLADNFYNVGNPILLPDSTIALLGLNGISQVIPTKLRSDTLRPQVSFDDLRVSHAQVQVGDSLKGRVILPGNLNHVSGLELTYQENEFSIGFNAIVFPHSEHVAFAYMLEGFDKDWVYTKENRVNYTNLPFKEFRLRVKAAQKDGPWSEEITLPIRISPPWWRTHWAYFGYVLLAVGMLLIMRQILIIRVNLQNSVKIERIKREKIEELTQLKQRFITNISHELRTPITLILAPLEQLIRNKVESKQEYNVLENIRKNGNRLLLLVDQLLDVQKNESGMTQLKVSQADLIPFCREIVMSFQQLSHSESIRLQLCSELDAAPMYFDWDQMEKVIFNLLANAIKFTPPGGTITLSIAEDTESGEVCMNFQDTGKGIAPEDLPNIFSRFYQASQHQDHGPLPGIGIGLSLVQDIVQLHHGSIAVTSEVHQGTSFQLRFKKGKAHFDPGAVKFIPESQAPYIQEFPANPVEVPPLSPGESKPVLLIVDDDPEIRAFLSSYLKQYYRVHEAANGREGLELAQSLIPDVILSDLIMPEMDGIAFCKKIKALVETSHIPIIVLTGRSTLLYKLHGFETGADDYMTKPFNPQLLHIRIKNLLENRQKLRDIFSKRIELEPSQLVINSLDEEFLEKAIQVVERNMDVPDFSVDRFADFMCLSRTQLYRKIKSLTGLSPNKFVRSIRLKRAAQLLEAQRYTVSEVSFMVGFQDQKYFREKFRQEFGVNPSHYLGNN